VDVLASTIGQVFEHLGWFLDDEPALWLLLLVVLAIRPPALREIRLTFNIAHTMRYRHLSNLNRFRSQLVKRQLPDIKRAP
jgi:hypothetical protein